MKIGLGKGVRTWTIKAAKETKRKQFNAQN